MGDILADASALINGARQDAYGPARPHFEQVAALWSAVLEFPVSPEQVCLCMALLKAARVAGSLAGDFHRDSLVDLAGYAALIERVADEAGEIPC